MRCQAVLLASMMVASSAMNVTDSWSNATLSTNSTNATATGAFETQSFSLNFGEAALRLTAAEMVEDAEEINMAFAKIAKNAGLSMFNFALDVLCIGSDCVESRAAVQLEANNVLLMHVEADVDGDANLADLAADFAQAVENDLNSGISLLKAASTFADRVYSISGKLAGITTSSRGLNGDDDDMSGGVIAGICVGCVVLVALVALFFMQSKKAPEEKAAEPIDEEVPEVAAEAENQ